MARSFCAGSIAWLLGLAIAAANCALPARGEGLRSQIDALAQPLIDDKAAIGLVVGVVRSGESEVFGYGETVKGSGKRPDARTVYEIGSVTKVFTGVLLAQQIEAGKVKLDDPLQSLLPSEVQAPVFESQPISLLHLATHTSGLPRLPSNMKPADPANPYADYTAEQMLAFLKDHRLRRAPGEYEYSNYAMGLLGYLLARCGGLSYEELLQRQICQPLSMNDTSVQLNDDQRRRLASPYGPGLEPAKNWDIPTLAGAGGVRSTAADMLKFLEANLDQENGPMHAALQRAQEPQHALKDGLGVGLGWHIARDKTTRWHNGMTGGYASWISIVPGRSVGVVVLANTAASEITPLGEQITRVALGLPAGGPTARKTVNVEPAVLKSYVGYYAITPQFGLDVRLEDGRLLVQATGQQTLPIFAESKTKFFYKAVDAQITFVPDDKGQVNKLILHQNGRNLEAAREKR